MLGSIKKLFGGIFGLLGGIVGLVTGLFGSKKKGEFFMELDEAEKGQPENGSKPAAAAKAEAKPAPSQSAKETKKAAPSPSAKAEAPKPAPVAVAPSKPQPQAATTFAPNYLIAPSTGSSRRRPGPSLKEFQSMARQLKSS
jgi:hypothetical protein